MKRIILQAVVIGMTLMLSASLSYAGLEPLGGEFQINTTTAGDQGSFSVGTDDNGNFVSAWTSPVSESCDSQDIFFQLFDSSGNKIGGEIAGPEYVDEAQRSLSVAMDADGDFVIVWAEGTDTSIGPCPPTNPDGDAQGIYAQRYFSDGTPNGSVFQVNTTWQNSQQTPIVAMNATGDFVIAWYDALSVDNGDVFAQLFDSAGNKVGNEILVNSTTAGTQIQQKVSINDNREFIVVWTGNDSDGDGVYAQRFDSSASPVGGEFQVNQTETLNQRTPSVFLFNDGSFVITWADESDGWDILFQRFDSSGNRVNSETMAFPDNSNTQIGTEISGNRTSKQFFISWENNDSDLRGVAGRLFTTTGQAFSSVVQINSTEFDYQLNQNLAFSISDKIIVVWRDSGSADGDGNGGFGQRYKVTQDGAIPTLSEAMLVLMALLLMLTLIWAISRRSVSTDS